MSSDHCKRQRKPPSNTTTANPRAGEVNKDSARSGGKLIDLPTEKKMAQLLAEKIAKALQDPKNLEKAAHVISEWTNKSPAQKKR